MDNRISHGSGQMRAQSFSIQVSSRERCNAGCEFCISRTTPGSGSNEGGIRECSESRLRVGLGYAKQLGATHAILTSKADPTQEDPVYLYRLVQQCREYLPLVDMHTNGILLQKGSKKTLLKGLSDAGLTMITFSVASFDPWQNQQLMHVKQDIPELVAEANELELLVRCSLVVNQQGMSDSDGVVEYVRQAGELGVHMVVIREVWVPEVYGDYNRDVFEWNQENRIDIKPVQEQFIERAANSGNAFGLRQLEPLPWGTPVFVMEGVFKDNDHGVNVTFARCDEATTGTVMKSIVHKPNGHGYRNWDHNGDILY